MTSMRYKRMIADDRNSIKYPAWYMEVSSSSWFVLQLTYEVTNKCTYLASWQRASKQASFNVCKVTDLDFSYEPSSSKSQNGNVTAFVNGKGEGGCLPPIDHPPILLQHTIEFEYVKLIKTSNFGSLYILAYIIGLCYVWQKKGIAQKNNKQKKKNPKKNHIPV